MSDTMQNTWEKFQKETQEPSLCGACGQYYEENEQGDDAYHAPELCDANDETWANLPTTCPDFVSHPHLVNGRGCYTCQVALASEEQGTTALMSALLDLKIPCDVHQTGGFTMCVYIKTGEDSFIYANEEGFGIYENDEDEGSNTYFGDDFKNQKPSEKAQKIAETMKAKNLQALEQGE
jgi:hypothetical protein